MEIAMWMNIDSKHVEQQGASCTQPMPCDQPIYDKESFPASNDDSTAFS